MSERRYKDYDERFAKDTVFYIDAREAYPLERERAQVIYVYSNPECTEKVLGEKLKTAFENGLLVQFKNFSDSSFVGSGSIGDYVSKALGFITSLEKNAYAVAFTGPSFEVMTAFSGDSQSS